MGWHILAKTLWQDQEKDWHRTSVLNPDGAKFMYDGH
jgi:hypothetical protein